MIRQVVQVEKYKRNDVKISWRDAYEARATRCPAENVNSCGRPRDSSYRILERH